MLPRLPRPRLPKHLARVRTSAIAHTRRAGVNALMHAANVPVVRPFAELGMRTMFDSLAKDWERIRNDPSYRAGFDEALALLPRDFRPRRALDVACGTGLACRLLLEHWPGLRIDGIDISPRMVERARVLVPEATFTVGSTRRLPYEDGQFDLVTLLDGLVEPGELMRVLHRKGRLLVVYSHHGTTPVSRPLPELALEFEQLGALANVHTDGPAHVLLVRHGR